MSIKRLFHNVGFYGLLDIIQRSVGVILVPVYTRVLSQRDYGNLDLILTVMSVLLVIVDLQLIPGFSRFYLEQWKTGTGKRFAGTCINARLVLGTSIAVVFLLFGFYGFIEFSFLPSFLSNETSWIIAAAMTPVALTYDVLLLQTRMLRWKKWFTIGALANCLLSCILCLLFTVWIEWGIVGVVIGQFLGRAIATSLLLAGLKQEISLTLDTTILPDLLRYTLPLVPGWWIAFSSAYMSRFFIYGIQGADQSAIFAVCMKLVYLLGLFSVSFRMAWQPLAMSYIGDDRGEAFFVESMRIFMAGGLASICCLTVLSGPIMVVFAPDSYRSAVSYFPYFAVGTIIGEWENTLQLGSHISKKTYWISISSVFYFAINLMFLMFLTERYGILAAALGLLVSSIARAGITYFSSQMNNFIGYNNKSTALFCLGCGALFFLTVIKDGDLINAYTYFGIIVLIGCMLPWFIFVPSERQIIKKRVLDVLLRSSS